MKAIRVGVGAAQVCRSPRSVRWEAQQGEVISAIELRVLREVDVLEVDLENRLEVVEES